MTSQIVRSDLTPKQTLQVQRRIISKRKAKEMRTIAVGRGRRLKIEQFPQLSKALEHAFGEGDVRDAGGGGLESHPRLTNGVLYKSVDNVTTMKKAREILLSLAPAGFSISLSACYNYTENYREGSLQAKRHHAGKGVNAQISLKMPSRTGVEKLVVNLHWSTANVNLIVDYAESKNSVVISKDCKAIVPANITPVQKPGHSWSKREELDHSWDQSRTNAVTPMSFLFLQTQVNETLSQIDFTGLTGKLLTITRSGQGVTLVNPSFFEHDTTFKCLNELLLLLTLPGLDSFFRDPLNGKLKKEMVFIVDNGPSEQPSSYIVQMCLVRLVAFLKLNKVTQVAFAEYHSKRNFVERVHAQENQALYKHGSFKSHAVHERAATGSKMHRENMEHMCEEV